LSVKILSLQAALHASETVPSLVVSVSFWTITSIQYLVAVAEDGKQEGKASVSTTDSTTTARQRISHAHPLPQHINPDYKPSNELQVHHCSALQFFCLLIVFQSEQQMKDLLNIQFRGRERLLCLLSFCTRGAFTYVEGIEERGRYICRRHRG
jgi:hypothetical protein